MEIDYFIEVNTEGLRRAGEMLEQKLPMSLGKMFEEFKVHSLFDAMLATSGLQGRSLY